jgi:hypothetical protein
MQGSTRSKTTGHSRLWRRPIAATVVMAVLVAGCGGSSGTTTTNRRPNDTAASTGGSQSKTQIHQNALNFAKCMRANGVPNFPDPSPGGGFQVGAGLNVAAPVATAAQAKCQKFTPGGGPLSPGPPPSAQTMAQLRRIAVCMRQHGVPQFPDPKSSVPPGFRPNPAEYREITNYMGAILLYPARIDPQSPAYEQASAACGAGFLAGNNAH